MKKLEEAVGIISNFTLKSLDGERVDLNESGGRILAEDIYSDMDFPSFDKSAMDGYAIKKEDIEKQLKVLEFIPAGKMPEMQVVSGCCSKIMTGAMLPEGTDMVVKIEDVSLDGDGIKINDLNSKANILFRGEDVKNGDLILPKGIKINAAHAGLLASVGAVNPLVYKKPRLSIISTGSELVSPEIKPVSPQIRNSNSSQLYALAKDSGAEIIETSQVEDDEQKIFDKVENALADSDIVVLTGGASVGDLDFTSQVFEGLQSKIHFTKLAIQPGKPVLFATIGNKFLFGLSGNPVSSFVQFNLLVKPLIGRLNGNTKNIACFKLPMANEIKRKKTERMLFFPVRINENNELETIEYHGSAHLNAYAYANAIASFDIGQNIINKGDLADVRPL